MCGGVIPEALKPNHFKHFHIYLFIYFYFFGQMEDFVYVCRFARIELYVTVKHKLFSCKLNAFLLCCRAAHGL